MIVKSTSSTPMPSTRLKITQILEATGGGTRRHLRHLAYGLDPALFELSIICSPGRERTFEQDIVRMRERGIKVYTTPMAPGYLPFQDWTASRRTGQMLTRIRPDIVHTHSTRGGWIGRRAAKMAGVPLLLHSPHCWPFDMGFSPLKKRLVLHLEKTLASITDGFICCCEDERVKGLNNRLAEKDKFHVVANGIDLTAQSEEMTPVHPPTNDSAIFTIGLVGRFEPQKGFLWFVKAIAPILKARAGIRLILIGDGSQKAGLERCLDTLGIREQCDLTGHVDDPRRFFAMLDMVAFPSWWEGLPYTLLDALRAGKPVLATRVGGMPEVLAGGAGILIDPGDGDQTRQALSDLIDSSDLRKQLAARAVNRVNRYNLSEMVYYTQRVYQKLYHVNKKG